MIHSTAIVHPDARLGREVSVGPFSIVHANVEVGDRTSIGSHCEMGCPTPLAGGRPLVIGRDSVIRSHSVFYEGSVFGDKLVTGHRVTVREGIEAGLNFQIGTLSDLQGDARVGDFVRTHSNVHIGKLSEIGDFVWIFPYVVLTNDPHPPSDFHVGVTVEAYAVIATMSVVLPGVRIGSHSLVAAHSMVGKDVPSGVVVGGAPAKVLTTTGTVLLKDGSSGNAYPWPRHFHRGYPEEVIEKWKREYDI